MNSGIVKEGVTLHPRTKTEKACAEIVCPIL